MKMKKPRYVQHWVDDEGRPHAYFRREGKDIILQVPLSVAEVCLRS